MYEANYSRIFKSMPADAVMKIEVITEPGAKFDAEGLGGILNLITQTNQKNDGYSGSITASLSNMESGLSFFGRAKKNRFSVDANVNYARPLLSDQESRQTMSNIDFSNPEFYRQTYSAEQRVTFDFINAALNASWDIDDKNLFTFGGSIMNINGEVKNMSGISSMFDYDDNLKWSYRQNLSGSIHMLSASANASYQHNFTPDGHRIVLAYLYNFGRNPLHINSEETDPYNFVIPIPFSTNENRNCTREHTVQADYANPFKEGKHKLEAGIKTILRHNSANAYSTYGTTADNLTVDPESAVNMNQIQNIFAVYGSYTGTFGNFTANAGVRYEHTYMKLENKLNRSEDFSRRLNDVVPNVALTYSFGPASNLRLAYLMRISRPSLSQMNPYQMSIIGNFVQEGNPDLESEHSNRFSLTYTNFGRILGGNVYIDYKNTDNAITEFTYYTTGEDDQIIAHSTTANAGRTHDFGLGGFLNVNILQNLTFSANGRVGYVKMSSESPAYKNHGWTGNYGANVSYTAPQEIKLSAYGGQSFNSIMLQGNYSGWYYYGLGISRDFLKNKTLNVAVNASNFFTKYSKSHGTSRSENHLTKNSFKNKSWRLGLSVTWNFGHLNSQTKKTDLIITNDDSSSAGAGNSGSGKGIGL